MDIGLICYATKIDMLFLEKVKNIVMMEKELAAAPQDVSCLCEAKRMGFSDKYIAKLWAAGKSTSTACGKEKIFSRSTR